jgi:hypothetical protein
VGKFLRWPSCPPSPLDQSKTAPATSRPRSTDRLNTPRGRPRRNSSANRASSASIAAWPAVGAVGKRLLWIAAIALLATAGQWYSEFRPAPGRRGSPFTRPDRDRLSGMPGSRASYRVTPVKAKAREATGGLKPAAPLTRSSARSIHAVATSASKDEAGGKGAEAARAHLGSAPAERAPAVAAPIRPRNWRRVSPVGTEPRPLSCLVGSAMRITLALSARGVPASREAGTQPRVATRTPPPARACNCWAPASRRPWLKPGRSAAGWRRCTPHGTC